MPLSIYRNFELCPELRITSGEKTSNSAGYLQTKILSFLYQEKFLKTFFCRWNITPIITRTDRFSEDLDFDAVGIPSHQAQQLVSTVLQRLQQEDISVELHDNKTIREVITSCVFRTPYSTATQSQSR